MFFNPQRLLSVSVGTVLALSSGFVLSPAYGSSLFSGQSHTLDFETTAKGNTLYTGTDNNYGYSIDTEWEQWGLTLSGDSRRRGADDVLLLYDSRDTKLDGSGSGQNGHEDADLRTGSFQHNGRSYNSNAEGNLLIIHEDKRGNSLDRPDDEGGYNIGGVINFDFTGKSDVNSRFYDSAYQGVDLGKIRLVDIDSNPTLSGVTFRAFAGDQEIFSKTAQQLRNEGLASQIFAGVNGNGDNSIWDFDLGSFQRSGVSNDLDVAVTRLMVDYDGSGAIAGLEWKEVLRSVTETTDRQEIPEPTSVLGLVAFGLGTGTVIKRRQRQDAAKAD